MIKFLKESLFHTTKTANSEDRLRKILGASQFPDESFYKFGEKYFDGGAGSLSYGTYKYDGRYTNSVIRIIDQFDLKETSRILELGCAKGYILYEFYKLGFSDLLGVDVSEYAILNAPEELQGKLRVGSVVNLSSILEFPQPYDFIFSKEMLPHLTSEEISTFFECLLKVASHETTMYFEIQTARNSVGLESILRYDPTHKSLMTPDEWVQFINEKMSGVKANILVFLKELF
jgi:cyclopropane fatty-acyl-phospholipid synthase-like methyltransferase